jgi:hypothetical protein
MKAAALSVGPVASSVFKAGGRDPGAPQCTGRG